MIFNINQLKFTKNIFNLIVELARLNFKFL